MSFTSANIPSPSLAWQFESSNVDSVTGLSPLASNNSTISYNSSGKYNSSIVINTNNAAGAPASYLKYSLAALPSITVTCWIKPFSVSSLNQVAWGISDSTGTVANWLQFIVNASTIAAYGQNPANGVPLLTMQMGTTPVQNGVWYHTALTMSSSGAVYVYFNGSEIGPLQQYSAGTPNGVLRQLWSTWTASSLVVSSNTRYPGVNSGAWCEYDDLRVFNSALSAAQIQNIYEAMGMPNQVLMSGPMRGLGGDTVQDIGGYRIHTFTTVGTSTFTMSNDGNVELLVVAGGGGGGTNNITFYAGGGGGAGEYYYSASYAVTAGVQTVTVGAGGDGGTSASRRGVNGGVSVFGTLSANGGGGGGTGADNGVGGSDGGSGGGAGRMNTVSTPGGTSVKTAGGLGRNGGSSTLNSGNGCGGGGSATLGTSQSGQGGVSTPTPGGLGTTVSISGASVTYAAGGTGGGYSGTYTPLVGTANSGNGGAGSPGGTAPTIVTAGNGGSGIVIVRYPIITMN